MNSPDRRSVKGSRHFQHGSQGHVIVFGDDQSAFDKLGQPTAYLQGNGMTADEGPGTQYRLIVNLWSEASSGGDDKPLTA